MKIRGLECGGAASVEGNPATQSSVNAPLVEVGGESTQLAMEVEAVPEEGMVEILAPKGSDQPLDLTPIWQCAWAAFRRPSPTTAQFSGMSMLPNTSGA
jgi:hypothetical protein